MNTFTIRCNNCGSETELFQDILTLNVPILGYRNKNVDIWDLNGGSGLEIECNVCGLKIGDN